MFVNRLSELKTLNDEYNRNGSSFTIIYGRRRVGKTTLISEYIKNKPAVFYYATEAGISKQLHLLSQQIIEYTRQSYLKDLEFKSFEQLLSVFAENIRDEKQILVIDEYQLLVKLEKSLSSELQKTWDTILKKKNIHLILCGSSISMMHNEALNYNAPLYGRRTSTIFLKQMKFQHIEDFIPGSSLTVQMNIFSSFGTIPKYLELYDKNLPFYDNITNQMLNKNAYLYNEVKFLLKEEIKEPVTYFNILETISKGESKIGKIAGRLGVVQSHLTRYIQRLIDLDIIKKEVPVTEKMPEKSRLGRYRIKDNFIRFWFYYIFMNQSWLEINNTDYVLGIIKKTFNETFVSFAFEEYVMECILNDPEKYLGFIPLKTGRWWNNKEEIDIVAIGEKKIAYIECKWQNQKTGYKVLHNLIEKSKNIKTDNHLDKVMIIFSKSGFKDNLENANGRFFSFEDQI